MKVTLRQAHKLVEKIAGRLGKIELSTQATVNLWDTTPASELYMSLQAELENNIERQLDLLGARQDIRTSVQAVNASEINGLVAARKALLDQLSTYRHLQGTIEKNTISGSDALASKIASSRESPQTSYSIDTIRVSLYDDAKVTALDKKINELQLRVEAMEDQLTTSNATAQITIGERTLAVLRREGIVQ